MLLRSLGIGLLLLALASGSAFADCKIVHRYDRIVLYGTSEDPDVLLWDNRIRMRDYEDGTFDQMNLLLPHARLLAPGTHAVVQQCVAGYIEPQYLKTPTDAVSVLIITGPMRGLVGWVVATDIRDIVHAPHGPE